MKKLTLTALAAGLATAGMAHAEAHGGPRVARVLHPPGEVPVGDMGGLVGDDGLHLCGALELQEEAGLEKDRPAVDDEGVEAPVLDDEDAHDRAGLRIATPAQIADDLRHDAGRRDVGDPAEGHRAQEPPAQDQGECHAGD